jgi:hypothetical protein
VVLTAFGSRPVGPGLLVPEQTDSRPEAGTDLSTCDGAMLRNLSIAPARRRGHSWCIRPLLGVPAYGVSRMVESDSQRIRV